MEVSSPNLELLASGRPIDKMQGHWVLARGQYFGDGLTGLHVEIGRRLALTEKVFCLKPADIVDLLLQLRGLEGHLSPYQFTIRAGIKEMQPGLQLARLAQRHQQNALDHLTNERKFWHLFCDLLWREKVDTILLKNLHSFCEVHIRIGKNIVRRNLHLLSRFVHFIDGIKKAARSDECYAVDLVGLNQAHAAFL
jgi:hypothetical protein